MDGFSCVAGGTNGEDIASYPLDLPGVVGRVGSPVSNGDSDSLISCFRASYGDGYVVDDVVSSFCFSCCGGARGVLWDEIERDERSRSSCLWPIRSDEGVSYEVVSVRSLWVMLEVESSVAV